MRATTTIDVRTNNMERLIRTLFESESLTKTELAQISGLSVPTVFKIMNILMEKGIIVESGSARSSGGRRPKVIRVNEKYGCMIGISITRHRIYGVVTSLCGDILEKREVQQFLEDTSAYWGRLKAFYHELAEIANSYSENLIGTGVACPGYVNRMNRSFECSEREAQTVSIEVLDNIFGDLYVLEKSSKLAGYAQLNIFKNHDAVFVMLGRVVSGTVIKNGSIHPLGVRDCEFGQMIISTETEPSDCGPPGTFQSACSASRINEDVLKREAELISHDKFFDQMENGNPFYREIWDAYLDKLSIGLHNLHAIFDMDIVLGGEMSKYVERYSTELKARLKARARESEKVEYLHIGAYDKYDAAIGAAYYCRDKLVLQSLDREAL